jgi:acetyl esterase/lipase
MEIEPPNNFIEKVSSSCLRSLIKLVFKKLMRPPQDVKIQRFILGVMTPLLFGIKGVGREFFAMKGFCVEILNPPNKQNDKVILYIHGGAFCIGNPKTHRSITTRLAMLTSYSIWTPDYKLAPEYQYPEALSNLLDCYLKLIEIGFTSSQIIIGGDSAGGSLALALTLKLQSLGLQLPNKIFLISPVTDFEARSPITQFTEKIDPMISMELMKQAFDWYGYDMKDIFHSPLSQDLSGFPPILIQVGSEEILLADSLRLAEVAEKFKVNTTLQIYKERWHVFQLQAAYLQSAKSAINEIALFCKS